MKRIMIQLFPIFFILLFSGIFFRQTIFSGKLPVPSDTLVGMYHPYLDYIAKEYPAGLPFKNFLITDPIRQQIPWRKLAIESLRKGNLNPWNPFTFSGTPLATNIQSGFFYPLNILFLFFLFPVAWTLLIILQQILSGIFFYLFLKISMKLSPYASLFGALCFMFCGFLTVWLTWGTIGQTLLWLPLLLVLSDILLTASETKKRIRAGITLGLVLAAQYFAGHSQVFLYSFILLIAYAIFRFLDQKPSAIFRTGVFLEIAGSLGLFMLLTSVHWIPVLSELPGMSRLQDGALVKNEGFFLPFQNLIQFVTPDFFGNPATLNYWGIWNYGEFCGYIGIAGLFFVLYSIFSKKKRHIAFWFSVVLIGLLFALPTPVSGTPYVFRIPILSSLQPTRLLAIVDVGLCVLAAIGLEDWIHNSRKKYTVITVAVAAILFGCIWYVVKNNTYGIPKEQLDVTSRNILFPTFICILIFLVVIIRTVFELMNKRRNMVIPLTGAVLIIGISFFDLSRFAWKFTPFTDSRLFFPKTEIISFFEKQPKPYRITSVDDRIMPPNVSLYYGIESISGYDPLYSVRYEKFIAAMERGEPNITGPFGFNRIVTPKNITSPLFKLLGVRFVLSLSDILDSRFQKIMQEGQTRVYEFMGVLPRVYLLDHVDVIREEKKIIEALYAPSFQMGTQGVIEEEVYTDKDPISSEERADITTYRDNAIDVSVQTNAQRLLFIGNIYHKNWKAFVDGKKVKTFRTNYIFIGIVVPAGIHTVQLRYE
ncbi:MAG: hypothetical protein UV63_C0001G0024 [Microgenomates group bacterium GW2011_GWC1_43_11]|uniref:Bacterial membrane protein YfhO n=2 Tax=Candidatus Gottesmaniibacteriota TaxID=1752720 RepID=A0A0G1IQG5_9BACT|nr:MAG: hypothetical protein UV63_C0001G0024 [Microgenomates group bacterium GW2011_GWC1_43_11]KKT39113.1 MAG: hypothetical protein UW22_C0001G0024 [Candidatus Gottesmanbacteria bacterium GW2011_GWB1_44_11c]KKT61586.1 MAG: hypothetical protein UW52_C0001G0024 [Candidatus Gottesmanbacteria bacterium GW2011_GWA1_44_24b]HCM82216.1 hypothetical protein [Patescibacteria group bacterium]